MTMEHSTLSKFLTHIKRYGVSRQNRFYVDIMLPTDLPNQDISLDGHRLRMSVEAAEFPSAIMSGKEVQHHGPIRKVAFNKTYHETPITFRLSQDMFEKRIFDDWINLIHDNKTNELSYYSDYTNDIIIVQLTPQDQITRAVKLIDAYPTILSPITMDYSTENTFQKLTVTFHYHKWIPYEVFEFSPIPEPITRFSGGFSLGNTTT